MFPEAPPKRRHLAETICHLSPGYGSLIGYPGRQSAGFRIGHPLLERFRDQGIIHFPQRTWRLVAVRGGKALELLNDFSGARRKIDLLRGRPLNSQPIKRSRNFSWGARLIWYEKQRPNSLFDFHGDDLRSGVRGRSCNCGKTCDC